MSLTPWVLDGATVTPGELFSGAAALHAYLLADKVVLGAGLVVVSLAGLVLVCGLRGRRGDAQNQTFAPRGDAARDGVVAQCTSVSRPQCVRMRSTKRPNGMPTTATPRHRPPVSSSFSLDHGLPKLTTAAAAVASRRCTELLWRVTPRSPGQCLGHALARCSRVGHRAARSRAC
jgi:hypothetical protein